jgi:hypothetical protein
MSGVAFPNRMPVKPVLYPTPTFAPRLPPTNLPKPWSNAGSYLDVQMFETHPKFGSDPHRAKYFCLEDIARIKQIYQEGSAKLLSVDVLFSKTLIKSLEKAGFPKHL